ncbi:hypothetical protein FDF74_11535 [Clostridium niameyense]|uniref:ATP-binding protein n=1 Tax=Clostridium niameyense TaxID=1622073 RepID=A0A6M0RC83_9CLOT|nr:hypothetical protein [Clostridium niameyense]
MTLKKYFEYKNPTYEILKITPDTSIKTYNSSKIAKSIQYIYRDLTKRIKRENKKLIIEGPSKCSFFIDIEKKDVNFYFVVPECYVGLIKEKITSTWPKVTIEEVQSIKQFSKDAIKYQLNYKKEDALSLRVDRRSNEPLNSILNVLDIMQEGDRVGIFYNFVPFFQPSWSKMYQDTIDKLKQNKPIDREKFNWKYVVKEIVIVIVTLLQQLVDVLNDLTGSETKDNAPTFSEIALESLMLNSKKKLSSNTVNKKNSMILNTQMIVASESKDKIRQENNAIAVLESYKTIEDDNQLIYKKLPKKNNFYITDFKVAGAEENLISVEECHNLIQIPNKTLLEQHGNIQKIDVLEKPVPRELRKGTLCIGESEYKGTKEKAYLSTDKEFKNLTLCLIGPTRAGKTTLISNISKDSINAKETTVLFDFCGNCDLSDDVSSVIDKSKVLNIDCSNFDKLQGMGYNEITPMNDNIFEIYRCAKAKTVQLITLVNSINTGDSDLKARMERYLEAAAVTVFISNGSIKNVFDVLQDHAIRHKFIESIPEEQKNNLEEYIRALEELDEWSKATKDNPKEITGTRISSVQGILNRVSKLKQNTYMELMLKADCSNNINLVEEMQKAQLICIRMPEVMFSTEQEKDIYCTYWLTKIWGALQVRRWNIPNSKERIKVNLIFDELYQVPNCQEFLRSKLSQIAKFSCKPIISCHYLGQISLIRNELKAANSSYMLISGCDKDNFRELKEELEPYELEDLLNLKRYYSLNLIKYSGGWAKFITKLPPPIN